MKYKTEFNFEKAIIIDEKMIKDMVIEIEKYCEIISFSSKLEKGDTVDFDSLDELLNFENTKMNSLKSLYITARDKGYKNKIDVRIETYNVYIQQFIDTVVVEMTIDSADKKAAFKARMNEIFQRNEQECRYNIMSKNGVLNVFSIVYYIVLIGFGYVYFTKGSDTISNRTYILFIFFSIIYLLKDYIHKLQRKYYPPIVFYLGDGISRYDNNSNGRNNFFWSVIVSTILSIIFLFLELYLGSM